MAVFPQQLEITKEGVVSKYGYAPKSKGTETEHADLNELRVGWADLPQKNHEFVQSLVAQFDKHGQLSEKQWFWLAKLASELPDRQVPDFVAGMEAELAELEQLRGGKSSFAIPETQAS